MKTLRIGLLVCSLNCVLAPATQAQPITLRITGDGEAGEFGTPFTLDVTFNELIRQDADEMTSIFTSSGSADLSAGTIKSFFYTDEFIISAEKSADGVELTLNGGSLLQDLTINKRSPAVDIPLVSVDDLVDFYIDGNNQDADVILGINALIVDGSIAVFGGDITSIALTVLPISAGFLDFNNDANVDVLDIDALVGEIVAGTYDFRLDLTFDGALNNADLSKWRSDAATKNGFNAPYLLGDTNLDGTVDATDLNNIALNWNSQEVARWSAGDFNADGRVNPADLNELALNWRQSIPSAASQTAAVPEPTAAILAVFALVAVTCLRRRTLDT